MDAAERSNVGRVSFQKFNEVVEKTASKSAGEQQLDRELKRQKEGEIGDDEMADELGGEQRTKRTKTSSSSSSSLSGKNVSKKPAGNRRAPPPSKQTRRSGSQNESTGNSQPKSFMKPKD
ncbi:hypothetical protein BGZ58_001818 [Dissophora ornata]|nr:hypothetical protein BGZ58_001818 [Dissophora ornata]